MTSDLSQPSVQIDELLQAERALPAVPDEVRKRVLVRARSVLGQPPVADPKAGLLRPLLPVGAAILAMSALGMGIAVYPRWHRWAETRPNPAPSASGAMPSPEGELVPRLPALPSSDAPQESPPPAISSPTDRSSSHEDDKAELRLLERARSAVARNDFGAAWSALSAHGRQFPHGRLSEEREALKVSALLGLGRRDEARRVATDFRNRFPQSVLLARMEDLLKGP
jgi:hypothetical protein